MRTTSPSEPTNRDDPSETVTPSQHENYLNAQPTSRSRDPLPVGIAGGVAVVTGVASGFMGVVAVGAVLVVVAASSRG